MALGGDRLAEVALSGALPRVFSVAYFPEVESTQEVARQAARAGAPSHSVFVADFQSQGRGRRGRSWQAEPGGALMCSILFRARGLPPSPHRYTQLVSVALGDAIARIAPGAQPLIKWPNDVMLDSRKVAGVLAESASDEGGLVIVVGAGVNVHQAPAGFEDTATSVDQATGRPVDRGALLAAFLEALAMWDSRAPADLQATWRARLWRRGQVVRLRFDDALERELEVVVLGAEDDGRLRVRLPDGSEVATAAAELIL